jgi:hypothetical protein
MGKQNFHLCRAVEQANEVVVDLTVGGDHTFVMRDAHGSKQSMIASNCWLTPVISYVTFEDFAKQWDKEHPTKFVQGEPVFDDTKLKPVDVIQNEVATKLTKFKMVPVEHVKPLEQAVKNIEQSPFADSAPKKVDFVRDVAETDAFQQKGKPEENLAGQVVSWHDPEEDTTLVSSYAAEYDKIGDIYTRQWLQNAWVDTPQIRTQWEQLYDRTPDRATIPAIDPVTANTLKTELGVYPVAQTYYTDAGEAIGLTKKFRDLSDTNAMKRLKTIGIPKSDRETIVKWRRSVPLWQLKSGDAIAEQGEDEESKYVTFEASLSPQAFFRESCLAYVNRPWPLLQRDPELYEVIRDTVFGGKEFR